MRLVIPRAVFRPALLLAIATGFTGAAIPLTATAAGSAASVVIHPVTDLGLASQVTASPASSARVVSSQDRGARRLHPGRRAAAAVARLAHAPTPGPADAASAQSSSDNGSSGQLLQHFNGVSSLDSEVTNFGATFEPPDQGLCEGNGFVLEPVNSAYTIYRTNGRPIAGPFNVNDLFHRGPLEFTSDPRCYYDGTTNTWFSTILFIALNPNGKFGNTSALDISVNPSGDPTTAWTTYHIDTSDAGGPGCGCFGDQPRLGIDAFNLYVSTDEFSINGPEFNGAQLYAFAKQDLVRLKRHVHFAHFGNLNIADVQTLAIEPAVTNGPSDAEYFLEAIDPNHTFDNRIGVWAMTNRDKVGRGEAPTLSSVVIGSETFGMPPPAVQKGSMSTLDSGDDRMQQTQFINGTIWGELDTALTIPHDRTVRSAAAWFNVKPALNDEELASATLTRQGYVALRGNYVLYPAVQADQSGNAAMVVSVSGPDRFGSAAYTTMRSGQSAFGPVTVAARGTGPYDSNATRWGDYSWAQLDPKTDTFWLATEYIPPVSSQTTTRASNWGTEVLEVSVSGGNHQG
jgi:hypothetical protein